ncbi:hypothetical protein P9209_22265 [Prescottella defluvii]|nr:hypothetical protein P9209_22265 [Prescottella defluvii]
MRTALGRSSTVRLIGGAAVAALVIAGCSSNESHESRESGTGTTPSATAGAASSTVVLQKVDDTALNDIVAGVAKDLQIPGAVAILKTPDGDYTVKYGTGARGWTRRSTPSNTSALVPTPRP